MRTMMGTEGWAPAWWALCMPCPTSRPVCACVHERAGVFCVILGADE